MPDNSVRFQELYGQSQDGVILHTGEQIVYINRSAARLFCVDDPAFLVGKAIYDIIPAYSREIVRQRFRLLLEEGIPIHRVEDKMMRPDGSLIDLEISASIVSDVSRRLVQLNLMDITERKRMEKDLKASKTELDRAQKIARMGSWEWDLQLRKLSWSEETTRILGLDPSIKMLSPDTWLDYVHQDDRERIRAFLSQSRALPAPGKIDFRIITGDGKLKHVHLEGEMELDGSGKPLRVFGVFHDITERKQAEAELQEAKAQAELYLDLMGHDINNMNQIAMGYLELAIETVKAGGSIDASTLFLIEKPMETLRSNSRLISNVRKVRREKAGTYKPEIIEMDTLLKSVRDEFTGITGREIAINITTRDSPRVQANELLKDVFVNLVGNAIKHSDPGKTLKVDIYAGLITENGSPYCIVTVEDNGPGIPDDHKKQLFDLLSLDKVRTSGKGLGLCLTNMLVRDYGGSLAVENRIPDDYRYGTRFIVLLPALRND